jgi:protein O-mannosyl-transferase
MPGKHDNSQSVTWLVFAGLLLVTLAAYSRVWSLGFVDYDDGDYVFNNPAIQGGLSWTGLVWAFSSTYASNWHPLTWISHMIDVQIFALHPGGHHLTSLAFHTANSLLLFAFVRTFGGGICRSAFVAALFALHPLHVESVAWVSERKDVLSTFFGLLSLLAFRGFQNSLAMPGGRSKRLYCAALGFFALSLMSKPMFVTLPFLLLLLDYWPSRRLVLETGQWLRTLLRLVTEKLPFFAFSLGSSIVTYYAQRGSTVMPLESFGLLERVGNAMVAYTLYLRKMLWPSDLAFFYPLSDRPLWQVALSATVLAAITILVVIARRRQPAALVGWLWYLGMLVPVIGIVQVGEQSMADRYTYFPIVGVFIMVAWPAGTWLEQNQRFSKPAAAMASAALVMLAMLTWQQTAYWRNSRALLERALSVTKDNFLAHNNLGFILATEGEIDAAARHFQEAIRIKPGYARAHRNLAGIFVKQGRFPEAVEHYQTSLRLQPDNVEALHNLGITLARQGRLDEALELCSRAVHLEPNNPLALYDHALALNLAGMHEQAVDSLARALRIKEDALTHFQLALSFAKTSQSARAIEHFERALVLRPDWPEALCELAWILSTTENAEKSSAGSPVVLAERARELTTEENPVVLCTLAAAYAAEGRFADAVDTANLGIAYSESAGLHRLAAQTRECLKSYLAGEKFIAAKQSTGAASK